MKMKLPKSCGAHKESHYAHNWVHNGFVTVNGEKMSKSLGNFTTVKDLLDRGIKGEVIRYVLLATKYACATAGMPPPAAAIPPNPPPPARSADRRRAR